MLRKIVIFFAVFVIGLIASDDLFTAEFNEVKDSGVKDALLIVSSENMNSGIAHKSDNYEDLEQRKYGGLMHYSIGARTHGKRAVLSVYFSKLGKWGFYSEIRFDSIYKCIMKKFHANKCLITLHRKERICGF